jgi:hypothetical protein
LGLATREERAMARDRMDLTSFVGKLLREDDGDILRDGVQALAQMLMDLEVSSKDRSRSIRAL